MRVAALAVMVAACGDPGAGYGDCVHAMRGASGKLWFLGPLAPASGDAPRLGVRASSGLAVAEVLSGADGACDKYVLSNPNGVEASCADASVCTVDAWLATVADGQEEAQLVIHGRAPGTTTLSVRLVHGGLRSNVSDTLALTVAVPAPPTIALTATFPVAPPAGGGVLEGSAFDVHVSLVDAGGRPVLAERPKFTVSDSAVFTLDASPLERDAPAARLTPVGSSGAAVVRATWPTSGLVAELDAHLVAETSITSASLVRADGTGTFASGQAITAGASYVPVLQESGTASSFGGAARIGVDPPGALTLTLAPPAFTLSAAAAPATLRLTLNDKHYAWPVTP